MKILTKIILIGLLSFSSLSANQILFDLFQQDYSESLKTAPDMTKYKINDSIILETNMIKKKLANYYRYHRRDVLGYMNLLLIKPINNWKYSVDITFNLDYDGRNKYINIFDAEDNKFMIIFNNQGININGLKLKTNINKQRVFLDIIKRDDTLKVFIDNKEAYNKKVVLKTLKNINTNMNFVDGGRYDLIHSMIFLSYDK